MQTINNRMTETQIADLFSLAVQLQVKAEESDDRDTAILAYSIQNACSNLTESRREFWAADATINNLELKITDMAVQLANAESKCRELAAENARAKKIISECREYFIAGVMNRIRPTNEGYLHMICDTFEDETPATDAFLAEVRAQGVDMFGQYHNFSEKLFIQKEAQKFAAQLRKGAANRMLQKCADAISAAGIGVKGE